MDHHQLCTVIWNPFQKLTFNFPFYVTSPENTQPINFSVKISPFSPLVSVPNSFCAWSSTVMMNSGRINSYSFFELQIGLDLALVRREQTNVSFLSCAST